MDNYQHQSEQMKTENYLPAVYCATYYNLLKINPDWADDPVYIWPFKKFCKKILKERKNKLGPISKSKNRSLIKEKSRQLVRQMMIIPSREFPDRIQVVKRKFKCKPNCPNLQIIKDMQNRGLLFYREGKSGIKTIVRVVREGRPTVECAYCGKEFYQTNPKQKYCPDSNCGKLDSRRKISIKIQKTKPCLYCGKLLYFKRRGAVYCSDAHRMSHKRLNEKIEKTYYPPRLFCL